MPGELSQSRGASQADEPSQARDADHVVEMAQAIELAQPRRRGRRAVKRRRVPVHRLVPEAAGDADLDRRRTMLADYLRLLAWWLGRPPVPALPPRLDQTLRALLAGDGEKQVAARLGVSVHTAHDHVKELYRRLGVSSRGELLTRFLPTLPADPATTPPAGARRTPLNR